MNLKDELRHFASDTTDTAVVVLGDDQAIRVLAAFSNVVHDWKAPKKALREGVSLVERWQWLTQRWDIDIEGLAIATALSEDTVATKVDVLVANRLIYPDGTISKAATLALKAHASMKLGIKPGRKPKDETK
jgi:hypothetical protein